jgi:fibronectin type 3 domain-containing protein
VAVSYAAAQTAGNLNVVVVGWNDATAVVQSVLDSRGNVYQRAVGPTTIAATATQSIYYATNIAAAAAGANTVTVTFSPAATFADVRIAEYRGIDAVNPVDVTAAASANGTSSDSGAVTTTNSNDLILGANVVQSSTTGPGTSFTSRVITSPDGDILEDRNASTIGAYNAVAPTSGGWWIMQMVAFRPAAAAPDTQPPGAPGTPVLTVVSSSQINLTWTAATDNVGVTTYFVERCAGANCTTFTQIAAPTTTSFNDTGLTAGTSYSYRVRATDAAANLGPYSGTATATTQTPDTQPPTAPGTPVLTVVSSSQINLTWASATDNVGVTGYFVERCAGASCSTFTQIAAPTTTGFNDTNLTGSTNYSYRVRATDAAANLGPYSDAATATTPAAPAIAFVQANSAVPQTTATSVAVPYTAAQIAGNFNVVVVGWNDTTAVVQSVVDSRGNVYTQAVGPTARAGSATQSVYYAANIAAAPAGGNTVTITFAPAAAFVDVRIAEYSGIAGVNPVDVAIGTSGSSTSSDSGAVSTTNANDLIVGANMVQSSTTGPGPSFASRVITNPDSDILEDRIVTTTGSYNAVAPTTGGWWVMQMVAFRAGATGPDTQPPTAPGTPVLTVVSSSQINLTWSAAADNIGVTGYFVERCAGAGCSTFTQVAAPTTTSFNDTGLTTGTSYSYRLRAADAAGNLGPYSVVATTTVLDSQPPTAPGTPVLAVLSSTQINIGWSSATDNFGVVGYVIERCVGAGCTSFAQIGTSATSSFSDTGLIPSTTYRYRVRATDAANNLSSYSSISTATTQAAPDTQPPTAPGTPVLTVVSSGEINLTWSAASDNVGVSGYAIERCAGAGCNTFGQTGTSATTAFSDTGLTASTLYTYRVFAVDASGNVGPDSATASAFTFAAPAIALVQHTSKDAGTTTSASLAFNANTTAGNWIAVIVRAGKTGQTIGVTDDHGNVYRSAVQLNETSDGTTLAIFCAENIAGGAATVTVTDSISGGTLRFALLEYAGIALTNSPDGSAGSQGTSASPSSGSATTIAAGDLVIGVLSAANSQTFTGGNGWTIEERVPASGTKLAIEDQVKSAAGSVSATGTLSSTDAWAAVVAGFRAAASPDTDPPTVPGTPALTVVSGTQINLTWPPAIDNVGVTSYLIERCAGAGCTTFAQVGTSATTIFSDTGLLTATSYSYRVRAADAANNLSAYSNAASATTPDTQPPAAPGPPIVTVVSSRQLNLTWAASIDNVAVAGYLVERCVGIGCTAFAQIATTGTTSFNDTGLIPSTSYSYRVRAVDTSGNLSPYSLTTTALTQADTQPPTAPGALVLTVVSSSQISLSWGAASDDVAVANYLIERCAGVSCASFAQIGVSAITTVSDAGLNPATTYTYRVRAVDTAGNPGPYSNTATATTPDTQPPTAPGPLVVTVVSSSQITVTWPAATDDVGVTGYFVERCVGVGCTAFAQIATPVATAFSDTGLTAATSYSYRVRATDAAGNLGPYSNPVTAKTPDTQPPTAPGTPVTTVVSSSQITVTWPAATDDVGVAGYLVERCAGIGCASFAQIAAPSITTINDTGLIPSTSYSYRVRATDAAGNLSPYSAATSAVTQPDAQPPTAPGVLVSTVVSSTQVSFSWLAATDDIGVTAYFIERCAGVGCSTFVQIGTSATTSFTDAGLAVATTYRYRVRATDAAGNLGPYSNVLGATTPDTQPPTAPGMPVLAVVSTGQINLSWPAATDDVGVTSYFVERCGGASCGAFSKIGTTAATTFNDTGLSPSTNYSYRVRATDAAGNLSPYSTTATAVTQADTQAPTAPGTPVLTVVSGSRISLTWAPATDDVGVTGYLLERCTGAACITFAQIATQATTSFTDAGLTDATTYSYRVRATDAAGNLSPYSTAVSASTPDTEPPTAPGTPVLAVASDVQINLIWPAATDNASVTGYLIERCAGANCGTFAQVATSVTTGFNDTPLSPSTVYSYRVRATDAASNLSPYSMSVSASTLADTQPPTTPGTVVLAVVSSSKISLSWPAATDDVGVASYLIERCTGADCSSFAQVGAPATTTFNDTSLLASTSYSYRLRATDAAGNISPYSTTATAVTLPDTQPPTAPSGLVLSVASSSQIKLAWTAATDDFAVTGYIVERCAGVGCTAFAPIGTPTTTSFGDTGLAPAVTYSYRVRATDAAGNLGPYSPVASGTTPDTQPPTAPGTPITTVVSDIQISVTWPAATDDVGVSGYLVERCAGAGCTTFAQVGAIPGAAFNDTGLAPVTSYTYRVRATDAAGNLGPYSSTATAVTQADTQPPTAPGTMVLSVVSSGQINLTWPAATDDVGVTGYLVERCAGNPCDSFTQIGTPTTLGYNDVALAPVTIYSYRVRATDATGNLGPYSAIATATTLPDTTPPTVPGRPVPTVVSATEIDLTWPTATDNVAVTSYLVERCAGIGCTTFAQVGTSAVASFSDTGLTTATIYSYRVRASDAVNNLGPYSATATATTPDTQAPTAPGTPVLTVVSGAQINLVWPAATDDVGVARYLVERCAGDGCTTFVQIGSTSTTSFVNGGLLALTSFSYRVRAADAANNLGPYSATVSGKTADAPPIALVQHTSKDAGSTTSSSLALGANASAGNWIVVAIRAGKSGQTFTVTDTAGNTYHSAVQLNETVDATTLALFYAENIVGGPTTVNVADSAGGTLRFAIFEYSGVALANSLEVSAAAEGTSNTPATGPTDVASAADLAIGAFASSNSRTFAAGSGWTLEESVPAAPNSKLAVEDDVISSPAPVAAAASLSSSDSWGAVVAAFRAGAPLPSPDLTLINVHNGTFIQGQAGATYTITVSNSGTVASNGTVSVTDTLPVGLAAMALSGQGWTCALTSLTCSRSDALPPGASYPDITLVVSVSFTAPSSVVNSATVSGGGETITVNDTAVDITPVMTTPPDTEPPSAPGTLTTVAMSGVQVNLSWGPATDNVAIAGYRVERCLGASCTGFVKLATPTLTSYTDTGLIPNATYTYIVRAVDVGNNLGPYSNASSVTTLGNNPNLVAAYSFDENSGLTLNDLSGTGNAGTIANATWTSAGRYGSALLFSGATGRVTVPDSASLHLTTGMTLEAWVNPSTPGVAWADVIYKGNDNFYLDTVGATPTAGLTLTPAQDSNINGPALPLNTWSHLTETFDGRTLRLYVNGVQASAATLTGSMVTSTNPLEIGSDHIYGQYFQGLIDEVRIYNVPLSPTQIQSDMASPVGTSVTVVHLSTGTLDFGQQGTGIPSSPLEAVLTNTGGTALSISGIAVTGVNAGDFALATTCGSTVASHDSCQLDVTMTASAAGGETGTVVISDNATGAPHTIALSGTGVGFTITPRTSTVTSSLSQQFNAIAGVGPFTWSVDGVIGGTPATGTVTPTGLYAPPPATGAHNVTVTTADLLKTSSATVYVTNYAGTMTHHNDNFRTGQNLSETVLTPANVTQASFGRLFSYSLDGLAMASPLYVAGVTLPDATIHNIVYVATEHDSVYAFDADGRSTAPLWQQSFISPAAGANVTTVPSSDTGECCDISPEIGITGTPVIDPVTNTLYVVAKTKEGTSGNQTYKQKLHALDIATGAEKFGGPVVLQASVPGTGAGTQSGNVAFDALHENQRPALLLSNGVVYIAFGSHGDNQPYHGWVLGYNATTLQQTMQLNLSPDDSGAGIWQANGGPATDAAGNIYVVTGNGGFNANSGGRNFGDSFVKLTPSGTVVDYFTPHDQASISSRNFDLGAAGPMLLPDQPGGHPHLVVGAGKNNTVYLIDREGMGQYNANNDNQIVQSLVNIFPYGTPEPGNYSGAVFFNGTVYFGPIADNIQAFSMTNGLLSTSATSRSKEIYAYPGATMAISANGSTNGILWAIQRNGDCGTQTTCLTAAPGVLRAYDASNLTFLLYGSDQAPGGRDTLDFAAKFSVPLVANGKVFVSSMGKLTVYGLLP